VGFCCFHFIKSNSGDAIKAVRFYVSKPLEGNWQELGSKLRDIQYKTAKALNYCMTEWYLHESEREDWKNKNGKYSKSKELSNLKWTPSQG